MSVVVFDPDGADNNAIRPLEGFPGWVVHVHTSDVADGATVPAGLVENRYEWDFGDRDASNLERPYNRLEGFNAAHFYTEPGTYTIRLKVNGVEDPDAKTVVISALAGARKTIYVDAVDGNDSYNGKSASYDGTNGPVKTAKRAEQLLVTGDFSDGSQVLFKRGQTHTLWKDIDGQGDVDLSEAGFTVARNNVRVAAYGSGASPRIEYVHPPAAAGFSAGNFDIASVTGVRVSNTVIEGLTFATAAGQTKGNGVQPGSDARNVMVRDCVFDGVKYAIKADDAGIRGLLLQGNSSDGGVSDYFLFTGASDVVLVGNNIDIDTVSGNGVVRAQSPAARRINISQNPLLSSAGQNGVRLAIGKYAYVARNVIGGNSALLLGPHQDENATSGSFDYAVIERNDVRGAIAFRGGSNWTTIRNNVLTRDTFQLIDVNETDSRGFTNQGIYIINNTGRTTSSSGSFLKVVGAGTTDIRLENNLYAAPSSYPSGSYILDLAGVGTGMFTAIANNVWVDPTHSSADGTAVQYNGVAKTETQWLAIAATDRFSDVTIDAATFAPAVGSNVAITSPASRPFNDYHGDPRPAAGAITAGAVELAGGAQDVVVNGTSNADTFVVKRVSGNIRVTRTTSGVPTTADYAPGDVATLRLNGLGGDDVFELDLTAGDILPAGALTPSSGARFTVDGGAGTGDRLVLKVGDDFGNLFSSTSLVGYGSGQYDHAGVEAREWVVTAGEHDINGFTQGPTWSYDVRGGIVNFAASTQSAADVVKGYLVSGYGTGGTWDGPGIRSSTANAVRWDRPAALGYFWTGSFVKVRHTVYGDADLDGVVTAADVAAVSAAGTAVSWSTGDFNYNGSRATSDDWALLNWGVTVGDVTQASGLSAADGAAVAAAVAAGNASAFAALYPSWSYLNADCNLDGVVDAADLDAYQAMMRAAHLPYRVSDINPGSGGAGIASRGVAVGDVYYFAASNGTSGTELWRTDGTASGTWMVKDIRIGSSGSGPANFFDVGGTLFFTADDGTNGVELWKSDGTVAGTVLVKDIYAGATGSSPGSFALINGILFFAATDAASGRELWRTDGTEAGTARITDINAGAGNSNPVYVTNVNGTLFFKASNGTSTGLWKSDGTAAGTTLLSTTTPGALTVVGGTVYYMSAVGYQLWKSDGTVSGTVMIKDLLPGFQGSYPAYMVNANGTLFFAAAGQYGNTELWTSDGSSAGTVLVKEIYPGNIGSWPSSLTVLGGAVYFMAEDGTNGYELWKSDGTSAGTILAKNINSGSASSSPSYLTTFAGNVYFAANDGTHGVELWKSDGSSGGTVLVADIRAGSAGAGPSYLTVVGDKLFFAADDGMNGLELWLVTG